MRFPLPKQVPAKEGLVELRDVKLWVTDTGGSGPAVIFLHPTTGSGLIWGYQQPVFAAAGYRVIAYSRRGHAGSEPGPKDNPGTGADDLKGLADALGIDRFHAVGLAADVEGSIYFFAPITGDPDRGAGLFRRDRFSDAITSLVLQGDRAPSEIGGLFGVFALVANHPTRIANDAVGRPGRGLAAVDPGARRPDGRKIRDAASNGRFE